MTKSFKDTVLFILGVFAVSFIFLSFLYPDVWFYHTRRLLISHETSIPLESTYILVSHFFHGGIQLWDRFDQMNNAYFVTSNGIYGVANVTAALIFIVLSPFFTHPGEALYHTHVFVFYGVTYFMMTMGGYVLLRKLMSNTWTIFISLLYLNTILTGYMMTPGLEQQGVYSFLPLLLYFILCFFEDFRLRTFLLAVLVMALCLVSSPYFTLGYFYQVVHFFILSCGVGFLCQRGWRKLLGRHPLPRREYLKNMGLVACCFLIIFPYAWWGQALHDCYVHGSGLGGTQGRFNNIFKLSGYFNVQGKAFANPLEFLGTSLDYHHNVWGSSWLFIGGSAFFLALAGLVLSKDRRKYIFASTIFAVILINTACFPGNFFALGQYIKYALQNPPGFWAGGFHGGDLMLYFWLTISSIAHGINALTNPFSFLVRSFHMASLLVSILFLPLVAMGLDSCLCLWRGSVESIYFKRRWFLLILYALILLWDLLGGTQTLDVYYIGQSAAQTLKVYILSIGTIFFLLILMAGFFSGPRRWVGGLILALAFAVDFAALMTYVQVYQKDYPANAVPTRLSYCYTRQAVVPDYQNPRLLPLREFLNTHNEIIFPDIYSENNMYGAFYQYTPIGRFFHPWTIYEPRHAAYKDLYPDLEIQQYLKMNPRTVFFADFAFDSRNIRLFDILRYNLQQRVIMVNPEAFNRAFLNTTGKIYVPPMDFKEKFYDVSLDWMKAAIHQGPSGWEYTLDLPKDFPFYLSTTVFTNDYAAWKLVVNGRVLGPMQGKLTTPYTYDVQNIQDKKLTILLPDKIPQADIKLQVKLPDRVLGVWKNTYDDLGLTLEAPKAGWLVFNYPYDMKWELTVDGLKTPLSQVNNYFIGAPISGGRHQVLLQYWPQTHLRFWIFISMVLSFICFWRIMFLSIKREPLYSSS